MPIASWTPTQLGYIPTGYNGTPNVSTVYIGRTVSGAANVQQDGMGLGVGGRPDYMETAIINIVERGGDGTLTQRATVTLNVDDVLAAIAANANVPSNLNLTIREIDVCDSSVAKKMMVIASVPYSAP